MWFKDGKQTGNIIVKIINYVLFIFNYDDLGEINKEINMTPRWKEEMFG